MFLSEPIASGVERKEDSVTDPDFSYKDVSQLSEVTDDVYAESVHEGDGDLQDYNRLISQTQKKLRIVGRYRGVFSLLWQLSTFRN